MDCLSSRCPVVRNNSILSLIVRSFIGSNAASANVFKCVSTTFTSHISEYFGNAGLNWNIPLICLHTNGCSPNFLPFCRINTLESAERAVFIALYPNPELYKDTKISIAFSIPGANVSSNLCSLQNACHLAKYVWYCLVVPDLHDAMSMSLALDESFVLF